MTDTTHCLCGNPRRYEHCCQPFVLGTTIAATPEQLMRSRFSAFKSRHGGYLVDSSHPSTRGANDLGELEQNFESTEWLSLQVLSTSPLSPQSPSPVPAATALPEGTKSNVEFVAFYRPRQSKIKNPSPAPDSASIEQLHENSTFVFEQGKWFYLSGEILAPIKLGRNTPCWCGSGKKLKHCH